MNVGELSVRFGVCMRSGLPKMHWREREKTMLNANYKRQLIILVNMITACFMLFMSKTVHPIRFKDILICHLVINQ